MKKKIAYSLLMIFFGVVLTLSALFIMLAFARVFPASKEFQQSCPKFTADQVKNEFIQSWLRMAGKSRSLEKIGFSNLSFHTSPTFGNNAWSGQLVVMGEKERYSANVILDCYNGNFDYTGPFEND